jgi:AAHS family 4-hydroxybenzoate transporter-like MFS transporter
VSGGQKSVNALAVIFYPTAVRSTGVGWALGVGRIGSIIGPLLGGWLMARGWSNVNIFEFASLPMLCAALVVSAMGLRYGSNHKGYVSDKKRHALA